MVVATSHPLSRISLEGYAIIPSVISIEQADALARAVEDAGGVAGKGGLRHVADRIPEVRRLADSSAVRHLIEPLLGPAAFVARAILFDKTPGANWKVPWHQDLTIAVEEPLDVAGFGPWTIKDGVHHVQPPVAILEGMLAVRLHLDDCRAENGAVRVIPGSHRRGRLSAEEIRRAQESEPAVTCEVGKGGALLMRPLLLHASSPAVSPLHRRVVHLEFASGQLPGALRWQAQRFQ